MPSSRAHRSIFLLNYTSPGWPSAERNNRWARTFLRPAGIITHTELTLRTQFPEFCLRNEHVLSSKRGAGYWMWKPFLIYETLRMLPAGAVLIYYDSGLSLKFRIWSRCYGLLDWLDSERHSFIPGVHNPEFGTNENWCKALVYTSLIEPSELRRFLSQSQIQATFSVWRKDEHALAFLEEWLHYSQLPHFIDDVTGAELPRFIEHRHDQAILSALCFKERIRTINAPTEFIPFNKSISLVDMYLRARRGGAGSKLAYWALSGCASAYYPFHSRLRHRKHR